MSDSKNTKPTPNSKKPNDNKINWRSLILIGIGLGLFSIVLFNPLKPEAKEITYKEFKKHLQENRVLLNEPKRFPLILKEESPFSPELIGYYALSSLNEWDGERTFKAAFNPTIQMQDLLPLKDFIKPSSIDELQNEKAETITFHTLKELIRDNAILLDDSYRPLKIAEENNMALLTGTYRVKANLSEDSLQKLYDASVRFKVSVNAVAQNEELNALLNNYNVKNVKHNDTFSQVLISFLPILVLILLLFFFFKMQMKAGGKGPMSFGKSKAKLLSMDGNKVTFKDVAGIQEAKEELYEIVDYLKNPQKFQKLGGTIPKGVLMVGSPGTGKTLLARAIAGEAEVPFFSISGSDFVEMFVGVGASRVRDMFEQGRKNAPCLIFIDEIDAVGRHRGHGHGGGNDEREQTLNALLVEMDGFDTQEGIIIIAATNRPDVLDPALLRPGRFDRQVTVALPDINGREEILNVHSKKIKLSDKVDLSLVARGTPGFSGAELANLINEAALLAARKGLKCVSLPELEEARDKVRWGRERKSLALSEKEKKNTAYHEAGHAILNILCEDTDPLHKVTIIPRGPALGMAMFLPEEDKFSYRLKELKSNLIVTMGGRVAEELTFGDYTNGAAGDIRQATGLARQMVCSWGMSPSLGMIEYGDSQSPGFMGGDLSSSRNYSDETATRVDEEIKKLIDDAYSTAKTLLNNNKDKLNLIAEALIEYETLNGDQIQDLMDKGEMSNPPKPPTPPSLPTEVTNAEKDKNVSNDDDKEQEVDVEGLPA